MHRVEILLGTYNGASFLGEQLDSIVNQGYTDWKLLIHDDNSTDETINIIKKYTALYPDKITFLDDALSFGNASENFGFLLGNTSANYVMFCDQDDVWLPHKIERTLQKMKEVEDTYSNTPILIHSNLKVVDQDLDVLSDSYWSYQGIDPSYSTLNRLLVQNVITGCTVMINRPLATMALPVPKNVIMHDWWLGLVASAFGNISYIDAPLMLYRQHEANDTGATSFNMKTILKKANNLSNINMSKYIEQAKVFLHQYDSQLTKEQTMLLKEFVSIEHSSWLHSKKILLQHNILKQDLIRNIGLLLCKY